MARNTVFMIEVGIPTRQGASKIFKGSVTEDGNTFEYYAYARTGKVSNIYRLVKSPYGYTQMRKASRVKYRDLIDHIENIIAARGFE